MSLVISKVFTYDEDAATYIQAVETADAQALEPATRKAINNFVIGCKQDGIWTAIKASCVLAGARTLAGALVPLAGTAPTNFNFVSGDYNRKTGLVGNGSTKYLNSNRANNVDPQNNCHLSVYVSTAGSNAGAYIGTYGTTGYPDTTAYSIGLFPLGNIGYSTNRNTNAYTSSAMLTATGLIGNVRDSSASFITRHGGASFTTAQSSSGSSSLNHLVFARTFNVVSDYSNARLAFYSIGESLDLARLDSRVTDLINAFGVTIP